MFSACVHVYYRSICVHGLLKYMYVCAHICVCMWKPESNLHLRCHPKIHFPPGLRQGLSLTRSSPPRLGCLLMSPEILQSPPLRHWDYKHAPPCLIFFLDFRESKSHFQENILPTEPSPQPCLLSFGELKLVILEDSLNFPPIYTPK